MIKINIPSEKGHEQEILPLLDGQKLISNYLQRGWIGTINKKQIQDVRTVQEEDEVTLYPRIAGG